MYTSALLAYTIIMVRLMPYYGIYSRVCRNDMWKVQVTHIFDMCVTAFTLVPCARLTKK